MINKKSFKLLILLLGILFLLVSVSVIVSKSKSSRPSPSIPSPITETYNINQVIDSSNWQTYKAPQILTKTQINFSVKYPSNWFKNEENPSNTSFVPDVVFSSKKIEDVTLRSSPCFSVMGGIWDTTTTFKDLIDEEDSVIFLSPSGSKISGAPKVEFQKNIVINGMTGIYRRVIVYEENQASDEVILKGGLNTTYGDKGQNFYIIRSCPGTSADIFNSILSTFQTSK
ncbi:MAG TPA: hypothetical protein VL401_00660 [Alphaproteobacteria bacterium]|jgi:hypothetical protein|nr:hypothetical protein [Alphaproteobacteria bacterium]